MFFKITAVVALLVLPFSISMWRKSYVNPEWFRYDISPYKSLDVSGTDGLVGFHVLSMPTMLNLKSEFRMPLNYDPMPPGKTLHLSSQKKGAYRNSWLIFPFWLSSSVLVSLIALPIVDGPIRRWHRTRKGRCLECAYLLQGLKSDRCPECGTVFR